MPPDYIQRMRIQLGHHEKTPLTQSDAVCRGLGRKKALGKRKRVAQIFDDRRAFGDHHAVMLHHRYLVPRIELQELGRIGLAAARMHGKRFVMNAELLECPVHPQTTYRPHAPDSHSFICGGVLHSMLRLFRDEAQKRSQYGRRSAWRVQALRFCEWSAK